MGWLLGVIVVLLWLNFRQSVAQRDRLERILLQLEGIKDWHASVKYRLDDLDQIGSINETLGWSYSALDKQSETLARIDATLDDIRGTLADIDARESRRGYRETHD